MGEIQEIDGCEELRELSQDQYSKREELKDKLRKVLNDEADLWRIRAKQHWLQEGDGNTKFFHSIANERKRTNGIGTIKDNGGVYQSDDEKRNYFYRKFKELFTSDATTPTSFGDWSGLFTTNRVSKPNIARLTEPFSTAEIKEAIFQLGSDKAPGPDAFPLRFYQLFWDSLEGDISALFRDMHEGRLTTDPIDYSFICLIPKKEGAERASEFRPISLLNGIQKILSKVLANRLEPIMDDLISPSQSAFLKGRSISDAFVAASELLGWGCKKAIEVVGLKVDFKKAYDRISWPFLFQILDWFGFDTKWIDWIKLCVCSAKVAVLVNGAPTKWIKTKRGVRQGDPLSPFLFLLVAECLARMTTVTFNNNLLKGLGPSEASRISIIQFADDTFFFCEAKKRYIRNLKFLWQLFKWATGMKVNKEKSELFYT